MEILTSATFKEKINSPKLVLIDFYADWCGPCKAIAPLLEEWSDTYAPYLDIFKVNIDTSRDLAQEFKISSIPTFKFFRQGECVYTQVGLQHPSSFEAVIRTHLMRDEKV